MTQTSHQSSGPFAVNEQKAGCQVIIRSHTHKHTQIHTQNLDVSQKLSVNWSKLV